MPAGCHVDQARGRLLRLADAAGGPGRQGDAAARGHRAGRVRARASASTPTAPASEDMRLSYCYPEPDRIREGVRRLAGVIEEELELPPRSAVGTGTLPGAVGPQAPRSTRARVRRAAPYEDGVSEPGRDRPGRTDAARRRPGRRALLRARGVAASGRRVSEALARRGRRCRSWDADARAARPRCADPAGRGLHRPARRRRARTARCGRARPAGVPYVGPGRGLPAGLGQAGREGRRPRRPGCHTPDWVALPHTTFRELGAAAVLDLIVARLGLPLMVKPAQGGSALGARVVARAEELPAAMVGCFAYGDTVLVERFVEGVEVAVSVVDLGDGPVALPGGRDRAGVRRLRLHRALHRRA